MKEGDNLSYLADSIFSLGGYTTPELKDSLLIYLGRMMTQAISMRHTDPQLVKPFYPQSKKDHILA